MEQDEVRQRMQRLYKLTASEADELIREAQGHLRKERLKQVRNQSRHISKKTLKNVAEAERKAFVEVSNTLQREWETTQERRLAEAVQEYEAALKERGAAHQAAREAEQMLQSRNAALTIQRRVDEANARHKKALKALRQEKLEAAAATTKAKLAKEKALEKEKIRAATVAALPTPEGFKDPLEGVAKNKLPEVCLHDQTRQNRTSYYEQPQGIVEVADQQGASGFEAAQVEREKFEEEQRAEKVKFNENSGKSTVRGAAALRRIRLDGAKASLEEQLETLRRREVTLRGAEQTGPLHSNAAAFAQERPSNQREQNQRQFRMETMIEQALHGRELVLDADLDISKEEETSDDNTLNITAEPEINDEDILAGHTEHQPTESAHSQLTTETRTTLHTNSVVHDKKKEHTVRFNDEEQQLIAGFQRQKAEMEELLNQARKEHERQMAEIEGAMKKVGNSSTLNSTANSTVNSTVNSTAQSEASTVTRQTTKALDKVQNNLNQESLISDIF